MHKTEGDYDRRIDDNEGSEGHALLDLHFEDLDEFSLYLCAITSHVLNIFPFLWNKREHFDNKR